MKCNINWLISDTILLSSIGLFGPVVSSNYLILKTKTKEQGTRHKAQLCRKRQSQNIGRLLNSALHTQQINIECFMSKIQCISMYKIRYILHNIWIVSCVMCYDLFHCKNLNVSKIKEKRPRLRFTNVQLIDQKLPQCWVVR